MALAAAGGVLPRNQDVPPSARISRAELWRLQRWTEQFSLPVVVLSYPWLEPTHPDRHGAQVRTEEKDRGLLHPLVILTFPPPL